MKERKGVEGGAPEESRWKEKDKNRGGGGGGGEAGRKINTG